MTLSAVKIRFFGAFRKYGDHAVLDLPDGISVDDLKDRLARHLSGQVPDFSDAQLIHDSAVACNDTIVDSRYKVRFGQSISILPPVCGG